MQMDSPSTARSLYLSVLGGIYTVAFVSFWLQYDGLLGVDGLIPVQSLLNRERERLDPSESRNPLELFSDKPLLAWFAAPFGLPLDTLHDLAALLGALVGLLAALRICQHGVVFASLFFLYLGLYNGGGTFYSFQWDILLLEVGFQSILYAPWSISVREKNRTVPAPVLWPLRFLLFKLMFMSGVVKVQALCPTWLRLTALEYHFVTQCIPTPLAWWAHQLPPIFLRLGVAATLLIEIPATVLLLAPTASVRRFGASLQLVLMILIFATGNYNFFNVLTAALCIPVASSDFDRCNFEDGLTPLGSLWEGLDRFGVLVWSARAINIIEKNTLICVASFFASIWYLSMASYQLFSVGSGVNEGLVGGGIEMKMAPSELDKWVAWIVPIVVTYTFGCTLVSGASFMGVQLQLWSRIDAAAPAAIRAARFTGSFVHAIGITALACAAVSLSSVPLVTVHSSLQAQLVGPLTGRLYHTFAPFGTTSGYGLFRRMTGVGEFSDDHTETTHSGWLDPGPPSVVARPEVVIEGLQRSAWGSQKQTWVEIPFMYKPGDLQRSLPWVAPHQPRLDWQMWFAALSTYQHDPWLVHLAFKLLTTTAGSNAGNSSFGGPCPSVLALLDSKNYPFNVTTGPPVRIRATLYHYDFTRIDSSWARRQPEVKTVDWREAFAISSHDKFPIWTRKKVGVYLPPLSLGDPGLGDFLRHHGWDSERRCSRPSLEIDDDPDIAFCKNVAASPSVLCFQLTFLVAHFRRLKHMSSTQWRVVVFFWTVLVVIFGKWQSLRRQKYFKQQEATIEESKEGNNTHGNQTSEGEMFTDHQRNRSLRQRHQRGRIELSYEY